MGAEVYHLFGADTPLSPHCSAIFVGIPSPSRLQSEKVSRLAPISFHLTYRQSSLLRWEAMHFRIYLPIFPKRFSGSGRQVHDKLRLSAGKEPIPTASQCQPLERKSEMFKAPGQSKVSDERRD